MPKLIAIEWDDQQARVMVARVAGNRVQIDRALEVALDGDAGSAAGTPAEALAARLSEFKIGKGDAVISVGRSGTELRALEVPRVPEEELPPMVRFQALRQFAAMTDDWKLDFIKQPGFDASEQLRVLAAAISPQLFKQIEDGCAASGLRPTRMLFRPFTLATMFNMLLPSEATRLCIDPIGDEADLLVLRGDEIDLVRTARLARNDAGEINTAQLVSELRRTLMAYRSQPDSQEITQCVICGGESELPLAEQLQNELKIDATVFDPLKMVEMSDEATASLGANRRRFAGLVGALLDSADYSDTRIDFLNPRKPPVEDGNRVRNNLIAALVALIVVSLIGAGWLHNYLLNSRVTNLRIQVNNLQEGHKRVSQEIENVKKIDEFVETTHMNWLDEISYVSQELPPDEVIVDSFSGQLVTRKVGKKSETDGVLQLGGRAKNSSTMRKVEQDLRNEGHDVIPGSRSDEITDARDYRWGFSERVVFGTNDEQTSTEKESNEPAEGGADSEAAATESETDAAATDDPALPDDGKNTDDETTDAETIEAVQDELDPADEDGDGSIEQTDETTEPAAKPAEGATDLDALRKLQESKSSDDDAEKPVSRDSENRT